MHHFAVIDVIDERMEPLLERSRTYLSTTMRYRMAGNFRGKSEKTLKINFRGFKFRDSNQSRGVALLHKR